MGANSSPTRARRPDGARSPSTLAAAVVGRGSNNRGILSTCAASGPGSRGGRRRVCHGAGESGWRILPSGHCQDRRPLVVPQALSCGFAVRIFEDRIPLALGDEIGGRGFASGCPARPARTCAAPVAGPGRRGARLTGAPAAATAVVALDDAPRVVSSASVEAAEP